MVETVYDVEGKVLVTEEWDFYSGDLTFAIPNSVTDRFIEEASAKAETQLEPEAEFWKTSDL